jgi:hypothetical protein
MCENQCFETLGEIIFCKFLKPYPRSLKDENKLFKKTGLSLSKHSNTRNSQFSEKLENHPTLV